MIFPTTFNPFGPTTVKNTGGTALPTATDLPSVTPTLSSPPDSQLQSDVPTNSQQTPATTSGPSQVRPNAAPKVQCGLFAACVALFGAVLAL